MTRWFALLVGLGIIVAAGFYHGKQIDRWGNSDALKQAVARIENIGMKLGDWVATSNEINPRHLQVGEIEGYASRAYVNTKTKEQVPILLICGRPGPISVHTPDICYQGLGYVMGPRELQAIQIPGLAKAIECWGARFTKDPGPNPLNILWTWSDGGRWVAPEHPRLSFYRASFLYKLYIIRGVKSHDTPLIDEPTREFLHVFMPELQKVLLQQPVEVKPAK